MQTSASPTPLKPSRYNFFISGGGSVLLGFNAASGSLVRFSADEYERAHSILASPNTGAGTNVRNAAMKSDLVSNGLLTPECVDELALLKMKTRIARYGTPALGLTIAPTLACNFRCHYCFEQHPPTSMSPEVEAALISYVDRKLDSVRALYVNWFGGEPLLRVDTMCRLGSAFAEMCEKRSVKFPKTEVVTNGFLLTRDVARQLVASNAGSAQVTLDGPQPVHDSRRVLVGGQGTFDTILDNIENVCDLLKISIRVNVDTDNASAAQGLIDVLTSRGLLGRVALGLSRVTAYNETCRGVASRCFSGEGFARYVLEQMEQTGGNAGPGLKYPRPMRFGFCGADKLNAVVVGPTGALFKCWSEISAHEDASVGHLSSATMAPHQLGTLASYLTLDPFEDSRCVECQFLPICGGGCPHERLRNEDCCSTWKHYLDEYLLLLVSKNLIGRPTAPPPSRA